MNLTVDHYDALEVSPDASADAIQKQYRKLAKQHHPDANPGDQTAGERFKDVAAAYDILGNAERREEYDQLRARGQAYNATVGPPPVPDPDPTEVDFGKLAIGTIPVTKYVTIYSIDNWPDPERVTVQLDHSLGTFWRLTSEDRPSDDVVIRYCLVSQIPVNIEPGVHEDTVFIRFNDKEAPIKLRATITKPPRPKRPPSPGVSLYERRAINARLRHRYARLSRWTIAFALVVAFYAGSYTFATQSATPNGFLAALQWCGGWTVLSLVLAFACDLLAGPARQDRRIVDYLLTATCSACGMALWRLSVHGQNPSLLGWIAPVLFTTLGHCVAISLIGVKLRGRWQAIGIAGTALAVVAMVGVAAIIYGLHVNEPWLSHNPASAALLGLTHRATAYICSTTACPPLIP